MTIEEDDLSNNNIIIYTHIKNLENDGRKRNASTVHSAGFRNIGKRCLAPFDPLSHVDDSRAGDTR